MKELKSLFILILLLAATLPLRAWPPAPASQAEVNAGTEPYKYVTPATLAGVVGGVARTYITTNIWLDKSQILLSGFTESGINGIWRLKTLTNIYQIDYAAQYTNSTVSAVTLNWNYAIDGTSSYQNTYTLTNGLNSGFVMYLTGGNDINNWSDDIDAGGTAGSGSYSNIITLTTNSISMPTNGVVYASPGNPRTYFIDGVSGSDNNTWPAPFRTLSKAISVSSSNSTYIIGASVITNSGAALPPNSGVFGISRERSFPYGAITVGTNSTVENISSEGLSNICIDAADSTTESCENLTVRNCNLVGAADVIFVKKKYARVTVENCFLKGAYDVCNLIVSNSFGGAVEFRNNTVEIIGSSPVLRGLSVYASNATVRVVGGTFNITNLFNSNPVYGVVLYNAGTSVLELSGPSFNVANTAGGAAYPISTPPGVAVSGWWYENGVFKTAGTFSATNGFAGGATNQSLAVVSTGCTNNTSIAYRLWITNASSLSMSNRAGAVIFKGKTITAAAAPVEFTLQPGEKLVGTSISCIGTNAW